MKTSYQILWVDDEPSSTDVDRLEVEEFLDKYGIRADIDFVDAPDDGSIKEKIEHHLKNPDLDLLMVDFNMQGLRGDELIKLVRETEHVYLPVIFYSSSSVRELFDAVRSSELDGVYIANRDFFMVKVRDVIQSLLVKEQTSKQTRGLLMEGVSEVDAQFWEIFSKVWGNIDDQKRSELKSYLLSILKDRQKSTARSVAEFPEDVVKFSEHINEKFLSTSYDTYTRWRLTKKLLELVDHNDKNIQVLKKFATSDNGSQPLNKLRNDYAHKTRKVLEDGHDAERCITIRRELREQLANIDAILAAP